MVGIYFEDCFGKICVVMSVEHRLWLFMGDKLAQRILITINIYEQNTKSICDHACARHHQRTSNNHLKQRRIKNTNSR